MRAVIDGYEYFEGKKRLFTKTWDEISLLCGSYAGGASDAMAE